MKRSLSRLFVAALIFGVGFAAGRYAPDWKPTGPTAPLHVPTVPAASPEDEARSVLDQLGRRVRELQRREAVLLRNTQEDRSAYQILRTQERCGDVCQRLLDRVERREEEIRDIRRQLDELKDLEQRVRRVADHSDAPPEADIDPALVAARALLLRAGEAERPVIPDERWKDGAR
jgi:hypothetical protein